MIYLVCFGISALFAHIANKCREKPLIVLFSILSIAVTVILAGLRDYTIGIDVRNYMDYDIYWHGALRKDSLEAYLRMYSKWDSEYLFALYIGSIAQFTGSYRLFLFLTHLVIVSGVYIGAYRQRRHVNPALVLLLFYLFFYNHSLNIMRQYMAMAIVFAALADVQQKKYFRYVVVVAIATFIHTSALMAIGPMVIYIMLNQDQFQHISKRRKVLVLAALLGVLVLFVPLCEILMRIGILSSHFSYYLNSEEATPTTIVSSLIVIELLGVYIFKKYFKRKTKYADFFLMCTFAYLTLQQLSSVVNYGKRIAAYFSFINILTIAVLSGCTKKTDNKIIINTVIIALALLYWWYMYVLRNASQTYPYLLGV